MGYVEDNDAISAYDSRITITKKVYRKYTNGKREVYISGSIAKSLASSAATIAQLRDTSVSESAFISKIAGDAYMGFAMVGSGGGVLNVNIVHSASFSTGSAVALYFVFFV